MLPLKEFSVLDINAEELGVPTGFLMENAGKAVAEVIMERFPERRRIAVACGAGNNGGDGLVAARYLKERHDLTVVMAEPPDQIGTDIARDAYEGVKDAVTASSKEDFSQFDVIVDAIFGTGAKGKIREPCASMIKRINASKAYVVSMDVPSGMNASPAVRPEMTVTFHDTKEGMNKRNSGEIVVVDIGIPAEAALYVGPGEFIHYPLPSPDSHKGMNGRALIIGGGPYTGAPTLAGLGAYRMKVDLVQIATPERSFLPIAMASPNFIVHPLSDKVLRMDDLPVLLDLMKKADAVLVGPGLGNAQETYQAIRAFIKNCDRPLVIDADAIGAVSQELRVLEGKSGVITPHAGEFELLVGKRPPADYEKRMNPAKALASRTGMTILLKGRIDVIASATRAKLNRTGNAGMSVGGTGDVLAGETVAMLARGVEPFDAARMAAFINGHAGDLAYQELGFSLLATDVIDRIPRALKPMLDRFL